MATIQGVYLALFGRPADPLGLSFFNGVTNNGQNLAGIGPLQSSAEFQTRFSGQSNVQIINSIYQSLFNRPADLPGLTFFSNALANGTLTLNNIAIAIYDGAQGADVTIRNLKEAAANAFTAAVDTAAEVVGYNGTFAAASARAFISSVTTTAPTGTQVDAAVAAAVAVGTNGSGGTGATLTLTTNSDTISLDATVASLKSTAADDTIRANITALGGDLNTGDTIFAGGGVDTLNANINATASKPVLNSVEIVNLTAVAANSVLDLGDATGTTQVWNVGSAANNMTVSGIKLGTTVGVSGTTAGTTTFTYAGATGTNDSATLAVKDATYSGTVSVAAIENLTIDQSGTAASTLPNLAVAAAKTITVTGSGALTIGNGGGTDLSSLTKFDASGHKGDLTLSFAAGSPLQGVTVLASAAGVNAIDLGANAFVDVVQFTSANVSTISKLATITNFDAVNEDKLDLKAFSLGADTTVGTSAVKPAGDIAGFFSGTARVQINAEAGDLNVYVDTNKDGNFNAGTDLAIKLIGVTAANFTTADLTLA